MTERQYRARVAAISVLHASACAGFLRAHGRAGHAINLEAAVDQVARILARHLGDGTLSAALDWASDQLWHHAEAQVTLPEHHTLH